MYLQIMDSQDANALRNWWRWLDSHRGDRAQLRRMGSPDEALLSPAFAHFLHAMPSSWREGKTNKGTQLNYFEMALIAAAVARIKTEPKKEQSFAKSLALPKEGGTNAAMSELRFQQLQKSHTPEDFFTRICRAISLVRGSVNVVSLADDIAHWLVEYRYGPASQPQNRLAVRWATDYYMSLKK